MNPNQETVLQNENEFAPLHRAFAEAIIRLHQSSISSSGSESVSASASETSPEKRTNCPELKWAALLVSDQLARGHICLDLARIKDLLPTDGPLSKSNFEESAWLEEDRWAEILAESPAVACGKPDDRAEDLEKPLVLDQQNRRLYLARYWFYQQQLAHCIATRLAKPSLEFDEAKVASDLKRLFPNGASPGEFDQCVAAANAIDRSFSVIAGGPGTGKTTTVAKVLALRLLQQPQEDGAPVPLKIFLMAPTGKAAQRLNESLGRAVEKMNVDESIRAQLREVKAGTIHRMLGWTPLPPERGGPFRHNADHPLEADVVLIDEASMVDLGLMWRLFHALPSQAQVILMGDRDQLASVEAGGVLSDLCGHVDEQQCTQLTAPRTKVLKKRTGLPLPKSTEAQIPVLASSIVSLRHSHRFDPSSPLGKLAALIREGDADGVCQQLRADASGQISWIENDTPRTILRKIIEGAEEGYGSYLKEVHADCADGRILLNRLNGFRIICAHREGRWGERFLNDRLSDAILRHGTFDVEGGQYSGRPVMVMRNDYRQNIFNGDVGVVISSAGPSVKGEGAVGNQGGYRIAIEDTSVEAGYRMFPAVMVPSVSTCFAITIHKSQGSEFHKVMVVLPPDPSRVLTRELLYTAVTRVCDEEDPGSGRRQPGQLQLVATERSLRAAVTQQIRRESGLRAAISERLAQ